MKGIPLLLKQFFYPFRDISNAKALTPGFSRCDACGLAGVILTKTSSNIYSNHMGVKSDILSNELTVAIYE